MTPREEILTKRLYLVCGGQASVEELERLLTSAIRGGVDIVQLRDHSLSDGEIVRTSAIFRSVATEFGVPFVLNDRPDLVEAVGADGVHVGQEDLSPLAARELVGPDRIVGLSTHSPAQGEAALVDPEVDYFSVGPVYETPTKPGRPAATLDYIRYAAAHFETKPWFAIGGINPTTLAEVKVAGATRVVIVRALTESSDPEAAARELKSNLGHDSA